MASEIGYWMLSNETTHAHAPPTPAHSQFAPAASSSTLAPPIRSEASPIASTSQLFTITPPATPKRKSAPTKASPRKRPRTSIGSPYLLSLDKLLPIGTVALCGYEFVSGVVKPESDGWIQLTRNLLRALGGRDDAPRGLEKIRPSLLDDILDLQDALLLRATIFQSGEDITSFVVRVYLIPSDLPELGSEEVRTSWRAKAPGSGVILGVLRCVRAGLKSWNGAFGFDGDGSALFLEEKPRSLLEIYREIESPGYHEDSYDSLEHASKEVKARLRDALFMPPEGFKSDLFDYQRCSLAKMLARELCPQAVVHPSYDACHSREGRLFYLDQLTGTVVTSPSKVMEPKGGILADAMGSGKTATCIALILSTLGELPQFDCPDPPQLLTNVSADFPFAPYLEERRKHQFRVPPLLPGYSYDAKELKDHEARLHQQALRDAGEVLPPLPSLSDLLINLIRTTSNRRLENDINPSETFGNDKNSSESFDSPMLQKLRKASPFFYLHPSEQESSSRHGRKNPLSPQKVFLSSATLIIVPATLVRHWEDEVKRHVFAGGLMMVSLRTAKDDFPYAVDIANDYDVILMSLTRFAKFADPAEELGSPLKQIMFKRILVDEGHILALNNSTKLYVQELLCESRWAITGTPSINLRGAPDQTAGALASPDSVRGGDVRDFDRLGAIFSGYLRHPAFPPKSHVWRNIFTNPILFEERGSERLLQLLNRGIVRNQSERIKSSYVLPPLTSEVTKLSLNESETKIYNGIASLFLVNSILTQRVDKDYLFHPAQRKYLDQLVLNFSASTFFFASEEQTKWLRGSIGHIDDALEKKAGGWTEEDRRAIKEARVHIEAALEDPILQMILAAFAQTKSLSVGVEVSGLDKTLVKVIGGLWLGEKAIVPSSGLTFLRSVIQVVRTSENFSWYDDDDLLEEIITFTGRVQHNIQNPNNPIPIPSLSKKRKKSESLRPLPPHSMFLNIKLGQSTSAKLNHVVKELLEHPEEKFLIFADSLSDLLFANIAEYCELLGIPVVVFSGRSSSTHDRGAAIARFNAVDVSLCRALLLDTRLGGRGIHLTAATRQIFLSPVWSPDLESQAKKRAHRLGQTKPVHLSVLVVPESYEDAMLKRRTQLDVSEFTTLKNPQQDSELQTVLQTAKFLKYSPKTNEPTPQRFNFLGGPAADAVEVANEVATPAAGLLNGKGEEVQVPEDEQECDGHVNKKVRFLV